MHAEHIGPASCHAQNEIDPTAEQVGERIGQKTRSDTAAFGFIQEGRQLSIDHSIGQDDHKIAGPQLLQVVGEEETGSRQADRVAAVGAASLIGRAARMPGNER